MYYTELEGDGVVVRQLVQALPEKRLATLIGQGRFDDAEELAKRFCLDPEVHTHPAQIGEQFNFSRPLEHLQHILTIWFGLSLSSMVGTLSVPPGKYV